MGLKKIFIDLDDTLIYSSTFDVDKSDVIVKVEGTVYGVNVKHSALRLVKAIMAEFGADNVFMLTAATRNYAIEMNHTALHDLFTNEHIISRMMGDDNPFGENDRFDSVLLDNTPDCYHVTNVKLEFLRRFGKPRFVQVPHFTGRRIQVFTTLDIQNILTQLKR